MLRRVTSILVLLFLATALAWAFWPRPLEVEVSTVIRRDIAATVEEEGRARIREIYTVSTPIGGQTERILKHAGDLVTQGEAVVSIRPAAPGLLDARLKRTAEAVVESARSAVDLAEAEARQATMQLAFLRTELDRAERLASQGTISESARDKARLAVQSGAANLDGAKASLAVRQRELQRAQAALIETASTDSGCCTHLTAPITGQILRVLAESEQVVQAGTPLMQIGDSADIEIVSDILSREAVRIVPGAEATVRNWGGPTLHAKVRRVEPSAITKVSALGIEEQRVPVILELTETEKSPRLGDGFRVVVQIVVWQGRNLLAVPLSALFRSGDAWSVYRAVNGKAMRGEVLLGESDGDFVEIKSGLSEGDTVILHPSDQIESGTSVTASSQT